MSASATIGGGGFRWDRERKVFTGTVTLGSFEYPLEAHATEDAEGRVWHLHLFAGKPYGPYRLPFLDD